MKASKRVHCGHNVTIVRHGAMFVATYDLLPASVRGEGATRDLAVAALDGAAAAYQKLRQREIEREDWDQHEADKARALDDGEY